ncbi:hypothetical protein FCV25MIE_20357 [Fagus crenata]
MSSEHSIDMAPRFDPTGIREFFAGKLQAVHLVLSVLLTGIRESRLRSLSTASSSQLSYALPLSCRIHSACIIMNLTPFSIASSYKADEPSPSPHLEKYAINIPSRHKSMGPRYRKLMEPPICSIAIVLSPCSFSEPKRVSSP